jgi:hypothetical protein
LSSDLFGRVEPLFRRYVVFVLYVHLNIITGYDQGLPDKTLIVKVQKISVFSALDSSQIHLVAVTLSIKALLVVLIRDCRVIRFFESRQAR